MKRIVCHIIIPAIMPAIFFVIASIPVEVLGCRARGLIALLIALREQKGDGSIYEEMDV